MSHTTPLTGDYIIWGIIALVIIIAIASIIAIVAKRKKDHDARVERVHRSTADSVEANDRDLK